MSANITPSSNPSPAAMLHGEDSVPNQRSVSVASLRTIFSPSPSKNQSTRLDAAKEAENHFLSLLQTDNSSSIVKAQIIKTEQLIAQHAAKEAEDAKKSGVLIINTLRCQCSSNQELLSRLATLESALEQASEQASGNAKQAQIATQQETVQVNAKNAFFHAAAAKRALSELELEQLKLECSQDPSKTQKLGKKMQKLGKNLEEAENELKKASEELKSFPNKLPPFKVVTNTNDDPVVSEKEEREMTDDESSSDGSPNSISSGDEIEQNINVISNEVIEKAPVDKALLAQIDQLLKDIQFAVNYVAIDPGMRIAMSSKKNNLKGKLRDLLTQHKNDLCKLHGDRLEKISTLLGQSFVDSNILG